MRLPDVFRNRDFVHFLIARLFSSLCTTMMTVAIGWEVYLLARRTNTIEQSAFLLGMVGLAQFIPMALLAIPGGQLADRYNRKRIFAACLIGIACLAISLFVVSKLPASSQLPGLFGIAIFFGVVRAFQPAAGSAMLPMLVSREELPKCIAWNSMAFQFGMAAGPALAGLLLLKSAAAIYLTSFCLLAIAAIFTLRIQADTTPAGAARGGFSSAMEGLGFVWSNKVIAGAITLDLVVVLLAGATALLPAFAHDILKTGPLGMGLLRSAPAVGAIIAGIYLTRKPLIRHLGKWLLRSIVVYGAATIVFGLSKTFLLSFVALAIGGAADMMSVFIRSSVIQFLTPDTMRGRVSAVSTLFISASNELGEFESGIAARFMGPVGAVLFGGISAVFAGLFWGRLFPALKATDRLEFVGDQATSSRPG